MSRNRWFRITAIALLSFALGFTYKYHLPKLESWLLVEIEKQSRVRTPIRIWAQNLSFHLLPLGVSMEGVRVIPQKPIDKYLAPAYLKEVGARLAIWPLIRGEVRLSQIYVRDSELNVFLRQDLFESKSPKKMKFDFDMLYSLPIDEILLENVQIQGKLEPQNVVFRISNLNLLVENRYRSLFVELEAPDVQVKPSGPVRPLAISLELRSLVEAKEAQISAFKLKADESFLVASGRFNGDFASGRIDNGAFKARSKLHLGDVNIWEKVFFANPLLPALSGSAELDTGLEMRKGQVHNLTASLSTKALKIDKYYAGEINAQATSDLKTIKAKQIELRNDSGRAVISDVELEMEPKPQFSAKVAVEKVDLARFLHHIHVDKVPVVLQITGGADCKGTLKEPFQIDCSAKVSAPRAFVHTGEPKNTPIADADDLRAWGETTITLKDVNYKANLEIGKHSKGTSNGNITYAKGFKINYTAEKLAFSDVKTIAGLKFEGETKINGSTEGTSKWATIDMNADAKDMWLEDWPLGMLNSKITYKAGRINFTNVSGQYGVSRYTGAMGVDLHAERLKVAGQIPFADLKDIQALFQRKFTLPIQAIGTGTGSFEASGPFNFRLMSYQMRSSFFRGEIANESFDELVFNVKSTDGFVESERIHVTKSSGVAEVKGKLTPKNDIDLVVVARSMRLEQSENVIALGLDLQGLADITMLIRGQLPKPLIELNGRLSRVVLADQPAEDSVFKLNFLSDRMEGSGQFFGSTLLSDFIYPYTDQAPFAFKLKARKWDFTTLFSLVSRTARQLDFATSVTMDMSVQSASGGFWKSDGQMQIDQFIIRKGGKQMAADKPMYLSMKDGIINSNNFAITSGDSYIKMDLSDLKRDSLNASINGKVDLSLLGLFTPFISDLRGYMALSMDIRGSAMKPNVSGSAYIERGYAKFADFYHPFSNVRADLLFNDNQILLNALRADLASGKISGDGKLTFLGDSKRQVAAKGVFTDVKINIPEGYRTQGSGNVAINGDQFPYTMAIDYIVTGGEIITEFGEQVSDEATVKASAYLPKFLSQEAFHPFTFAVDVNLKSPVLVNNSLVQSQVTGQVKALGTPDRLILDGTLTPLPGGKVFFRDVPFEIGSAFVEYSQMPPENPRIYLTANTRVTENVQDDQQRNTEHEYDVNLLVQGRVLPSPQITLTSQPPLNQREIVSLLALGVTTAAMDQNRSSGFQAENTATAGAAALLQKASGRKLKDSLGLDVKVSSSQPTPENASTPKVTLSKQWTPKFGASASSTLQANPTNDVKLEYKMNKNISVIGSWEGKETNRETAQDTEQSVLGLDLEYKVQFK